MSNLKEQMKSQLEENDSVVPNEEVVSGEMSENIDREIEEEVVVKRSQGRPPKLHKNTKLNAILESRGMKRKDLYEAIVAKYPDEPMSPDAVSRIVSGSRKHYSTTTLYRICGALELSPNMILDWEEEVQ